MGQLNLLDPLQLSHTANDLELAMQDIFIKTYLDALGAEIQDIFDYSTPTFAGAGVVERFTKQDGLVVLRRPVLSESLMRVIYSNWVSLGSKRGLAFLEFVLNMLWPKQYQIKRLFHPQDRALDYPKRLTYADSPDNFLTSRVHVVMNHDVNMSELAELAPTLTKLVPANVVPSVAVSVQANDFVVKNAVAVYPLMVADFEPQDW